MALRTLITAAEWTDLGATSVAKSLGALAAIEGSGPAPGCCRLHHLTLFCDAGTPATATVQLAHDALGNYPIGDAVAVTLRTVAGGKSGTLDMEGRAFRRFDGLYLHLAFDGATSSTTQALLTVEV